MGGNVKLKERYGVDSFAVKLKDAVRQYEESIAAYVGWVSLSPEEAEIQEKLAAIADGSMDLLRGVEERLKPAGGTPVYDELWAVAMAFVVLAGLSRRGRMPLGFVPVLAADLHRLRKVASSSASASPGVAPPEREHELKTSVVISVGLLVTMLDLLYKNVKSDVKEMLEI
ncbi:hypothetical protein ACP4OV_020801 [Aristida adscensionis]